MNVPRPRVATLLVLAAAATALAWPSAAPAQSTTPSLRVVSPGGTLVLPRFRGRVQLNLGVWIAATGGDFELRVARPDYDSPAGVAQLDSASGDVLRELPADTLDGWFGLSKLTQVTVRDSTGKWVAGRNFTFCPNSFERQRVDDSGPDLPRYPAMCGFFSPFTKGMVWGIESGWATGAFGNEFESPSLRLRRDGTYTFTIRIAARYAAQLDIPAADARVTRTVRVKTVKRPPFFFERAPSRLARAAAASTSVPDVTNPDPSTLPDLVALPLWSMHTSTRRGRDFLNFAATPWNAGPAPLVIEGFRRPGEDVMDAFQYFRDADGNVVGRAPVGGMRYHAHPMHNHWHFLQFASFTLHSANSSAPVRSRKQAFCLFPTDAIDLTVERADWRGWDGGGLSTACGSQSALWVREVLQAGWGDTYFQGIPGQSFDITKLPNGWYNARLTVNPLGRIYETTTANNVESRLLYLGGRPGHRWTVVAPWHGIEE